MPSQSERQITETTVMRGETARIGSRVKHYGQRWTGRATATVVGFRRVGDGPNPMGVREDWIMVVVEPDSEPNSYGRAWDWDRTELIEEGS
jgi:hypothetical protein